MPKLEQLEKKLLHYTGKAIADYSMIQHSDNILVCLSGGKDSWSMLWTLLKLQQRAKIKFSMKVLTVDQGQPGWDDTALRAFLDKKGVDYEVLNQDTYSIVTSKIPADKTYCSLCSRLRRGIIYRYAREGKFNKVALGHHRDDMITTLLMSMFYNGAIKSMPPKLLNDQKDIIVIRPLAYCQEKDIAQFALLKEFPIIPCNLCATQSNLQRQSIESLIRKLAQTNPKIPSNLLSSLSHVRPSQLMDKELWDFKNLESEQKPFESIEKHCHENEKNFSIDPNLANNSPHEKNSSISLMNQDTHQEPEKYEDCEESLYV